jgi:hypothetical protein
LRVVGEYGITLRAVRFEVDHGVRALMECRSLVLGEMTYVEICSPTGLRWAQARLAVGRSRKSAARVWWIVAMSTWWTMRSAALSSSVVGSLSSLEFYTWVVP